MFIDELGTADRLLSIAGGVLLLFLGVAMLSSHVVSPLAAVGSPIGRWAAFVFTVLFWPFVLLPYWLLRRGAWGPGGIAGRVAAFIGGLVLSVFVPILIPIVLVMWLRRALTKWEPEWPMEFPGVVPDRVATRTGGENARRNPSRTAATAAALMIGIALVAFIATLTNGMKASNREAIEEQIAADYVVTSLDGYTPFVAAAGDALAASPVARARDQRALRRRAGERRHRRDRRHRARHDRRAPTSSTGSDGDDSVLATLGRTNAIVSTNFAEDHDIALGSTLHASLDDRPCRPRSPSSGSSSRRRSTRCSRV